MTSKTWRLIINVMRDTAANGRVLSVLKTERLAYEDPNWRGLRDLTK